MEDSDFGFQPRASAPPSFHTSAPDERAHPGHEHGHPSSAAYQPPSYDVPPAGSPPPPSELYDPQQNNNNTYHPSYPPSAPSQSWAPTSSGEGRPGSVHSYSARSLGPDDSMSVIGSQPRPRDSAGGLSYVDERGDYYRSQQWRPADRHEDEEHGGLVGGAAPMARGDSASEHTKGGLDQMSE